MSLSEPDDRLLPLLEAGMRWLRSRRAACIVAWYAFHVRAARAARVASAATVRVVLSLGPVPAAAASARRRALPA